MDTVLLVHLAATWAMVGLIWFVQVVHYPLFARVGSDPFLRYEADHARLTTRVVMIFMPVELVTGVWLAAAPPDGVGRGLLVAGVVLLAALWASTALWQAPLHGRLHDGFDASLHRRLVTSNWLRTLGWSARGAVVLAAAGQALSA